ncbi:MAG: hypothetical protein ACK5MP_12940 [Nostocoides sp.]
MSVTFADVCTRGVPEGNRWSVARSGMIIERQQVLTTHNLAALLGVGASNPLVPTKTWRKARRRVPPTCLRSPCARNVR